MGNISKAPGQKKEEGTVSYELRQYGPETTLYLDKSENGVKYTVYERHIDDLTLGRLPSNPTLEINITFSGSNAQDEEARMETSGILEDYGETKPYSMKSVYRGSKAAKFKEEYLNSGAEKFFVTATRIVVNRLGCEMNERITVDGSDPRNSMGTLLALAKAAYLNGEAERWLSQREKGIGKAKRD